MADRRYSVFSGNCQRTEGPALLCNVHATRKRRAHFPLKRLLGRATWVASWVSVASISGFTKQNGVMRQLGVITGFQS
jgi:hypothetical protein